MTGAEPPRASATAEQVSQLRQELQRVGKEASNTISDDDLRRFFRATGGNMAATAKRLAHTAAWREQQHPGSLECGACKANPSSHYMHLSVAMHALNACFTLALLSMTHGRGAGWHGQGIACAVA